MPGGFCRISGRTDARAVVDGRRRPIGRCLGARRQAGRDGQLAADRRDRPHPPHHGHPAEPRRRQSLLARALSRTLRSDLAADPLPRRPDDRHRRRNGQPRFGRSRSSRACSLSWHAAPRAAAANAMALVASALHGEQEYGSALSLVRDARRAASFIRERLSTDTWRLIGDLNRSLDHRRAGPARPRPRLSSAPTRPCGRSRRSPASPRKT